MRNVGAFTIGSCVSALIIIGCSASGAVTSGTGGTSSNVCGSGLVLCGQSCADLTSDSTHCGDCSVTCPSGSPVCRNSACQSGTPGTGGSPGTGTGGQGAGGGNVTGGAKATGGARPTGGAATGGSPIVASDCTDVAVNGGTLTGRYDHTTVSVPGSNPNKNYVITTNWWNQFSSQTVAYTGNAFTLGGTGSNSTNTSPSGFPTIFIGNYGSTGNSTGSNLPKPVTQLTTIPTFLDSNASSIGSSSNQFNITYDVWFNPNGTVDTQNGNPGTGGYFLMVWLYQPSGYQPRGASISGQAFNITGVSGSWRIWTDGQNGSQPPCVSYVAATNIDSLSFDLNAFIKDARSRGYISDQQQLALIFGGSEVWKGSAGLQIKRFCAIVN